MRPRIIKKCTQTRQNAIRCDANVDGVNSGCALVLIFTMALALAIGWLGRRLEENGRERDGISGDAVILDFRDHPYKYKGKNLTMQVSLADPDSITQEDVDEMGYALEFNHAGNVRGKPFTLTLRLELPTRLTIPTVDMLNNYLVQFTCTDGVLNHGNVVNMIKQTSQRNPGVRVVVPRDSRGRRKWEKNR